MMVNNDEEAWWVQREVSNEDHSQEEESEVFPKNAAVS
jgi:hypothetical protein